MSRNEAAPVARSAEISASLMLPHANAAATKLTISNRKVIHATCALHRGPVGFANVVVSKRDGTIELDPHVLRHEALCCIPYRVGRDLEEYLWV